MGTLIDPSKSGRFAVSFGDAQTKNRSYSSVSFNQKPPQPPSNKKRLTTINKSVGGQRDAYHLDARDEVDGKPQKYTYTGRRSLGRRTYILTLDQDKQSFTMEPLQTQFRFNLTSAAGVKGADQLVESQRPIEMDEPLEGSSSEEDIVPGEDGMFGEADDELDADPDNPFDFRNYINGLPGSLAKPQPGVSSAIVSPRPESPRVPLQQTKTQGRAAATKALPKANKSTKRAPAAKKEAAPPRIQMEQRASARKIPKRSESPQPEDENDDGGFTLELEPDTKPKKKPGFLTPLGGGPISLRTAFSASPDPHNDDRSRRRKDAEDSIVMGEDAEQNSDADVDDLALGSPAHQHSERQKDTVEYADHDADAEMEEEDDDDDLEGQLVQALEDEDELMEDVTASEPASAPVQQQEESESEEE